MRKIEDESCVQKMHICSGDSATSGCTMPRFTAGYVGSVATRAENAQVRTKIINQRNA